MYAKLFCCGGLGVTIWEGIWVVSSHQHTGPLQAVKQGGTLSQAGHPSAVSTKNTLQKEWGLPQGSQGLTPSHEIQLINDGD